MITFPTRAGQFVTVGAQLVMVYVLTVYTVEVVIAGAEDDPAEELVVTDTDEGTVEDLLEETLMEELLVMEKLAVVLEDDGAPVVEELLVIEKLLIVLDDDETLVEEEVVELDELNRDEVVLEELVDALLVVEEVVLVDVLLVDELVDSLLVEAERVLVGAVLVEELLLDEEVVLELAVDVELLLDEIDDSVDEKLLEELVGELLVELELVVEEMLLELEEVDEVVKDELLELDEVDEVAKVELLELEVEEEEEEDDDEGDAEPHIPGAITSLVLSVIVPPRPYKPPSTEDPEFRVIETWARILPKKEEPTPRVALDPTCQKTLQTCPPPVTTTADPTEVIRVLPIWKYHASSTLPVPARIKVPVSWADVPNL